MTRVRWLLAATAADIAAGGWLISVTWRISLFHGLVCAFGTASTVGCDVQPVDTSGRLAQVALMLTAIPLLAAVFGRLHLDKVDERLAEHHRAIHARLSELGVADGPVRGGAGSNPAGTGLNADGPAVPPPATTRSP